MRSGRFKDLVQWQRVSGQSLIVNGLTLTPQSRVLIVRFSKSVFIWQRPSAILMGWNGQTKRLPIADLTRIFQLGLCGLGVVIITIASFVQFSRRKVKVS
jgi:hypothetical protein